MTDLTNNPTAQVIQPITIDTIFGQVKKWFEDVDFKVRRKDNIIGKARIVPVGAERWYIMKEKFLIRDEYDKIIAPIIGIEYTAPTGDMTKLCGFPGIVGEKGFIIAGKKLLDEGGIIARNSEQMMTTNQMDLRFPINGGYVYEEQYIPAPIFLTIPFKIYFKTYSLEDMVALQSQFYSKIPARTVFEVENAYVYVKGGFVAETDWTNQITDVRKVESSISLDAACYILPDNINESSFAKSTPSLSYVQLTFQFEETEIIEG